MEKLNSNRLLKTAMVTAGTKQTEIAAKMGILQSSVSGNLNRPRIGLDVFVRMLNVMGYEVLCKADGREGQIEVSADATSKEMLNAALKASGLKQMEIAEALGITRAGMSKNMNRLRIGLDVFVKTMNAMGYNVLVGKRTEAGFEALWEVGQDE